MVGSARFSAFSRAEALTTSLSVSAGYASTRRTEVPRYEWGNRPKPVRRNARAAAVGAPRPLDPRGTAADRSQVAASERMWLTRVST